MLKIPASQSHWHLLLKGSGSRWCGRPLLSTMEREPLPARISNTEVACLADFHQQKRCKTKTQEGWSPGSRECREKNSHVFFKKYIYKLDMPIFSKFIGVEMNGIVTVLTCCPLLLPVEHKETWWVEFILSDSIRSCFVEVWEIQVVRKDLMWSDINWWWANDYPWLNSEQAQYKLFQRTLAGGGVSLLFWSVFWLSGLVWADYAMHLALSYCSQGITVFNHSSQDNTPGNNRG